MNIQEYISSGILEAYMLGDLSERELAEVKKNLEQYPELRTELARLESTQEQLLMQTAIRPRTAVRSELMEKIKGQESKEIHPAGKERFQLNFWRYAAAACVVFALFSSYLAYHYRSRLLIAETNLNEYIVQNQRMASEYNSVNERLDKIENDLNIIENPQFKKVELKGTPNAPGALAHVYWNNSTKELFLKIQNLKQLATDHQYQLWAIVDGKPVDAGVFDLSLTGLIRMKDIQGAAAFAVTVEPYGGKKQPSLETMQVIGNVGKS